VYARTNHFEQAMADADRRLAGDLYENADLRDIMLVGFAYLVNAQKEASTLRIKVDGKGWLSAAILVGGLVGGAVQVVL
jgi:hypothetical protein